MTTRILSEDTRERFAPDAFGAHFWKPGPRNLGGFAN